MAVVEGPRERCPACGDPLPIPTPETMIIASGGFCMPTEALYALPELDRVCGACLAAMSLGIPREVMDGLLTVRRGGIRYAPH